jgi:DNA-binding transcriptional regulator YhcF (GntR family)
MSVQAMSWVFEYSQSLGGARLVLLSIANHASHDGDSSHPAIATIARETRMNRRAVQRTLPKLEKLGELEILRGHGRHNTHTFKLPKYIEMAALVRLFQKEKAAFGTEKAAFGTTKGGLRPPEPSLTVLNKTGVNAKSLTRPPKCSDCLGAGYIHDQNGLRKCARCAPGVAGKRENA